MFADKRDSIDSGCSVEQSSEGNQSTTKFQCAFCEKYLSTKYRLIIHRNGKHINSRPFNCGIGNCQKRFPDIHSRKKHQLIHCNKRRPCNICGEHFIDIRAHSIRKHAVPILHECEICMKKFSQLYSLLLHMVNHSKCEICDKYLLDEASKPQHLIESHFMKSGQNE